MSLPCVQVDEVKIHEHLDGFVHRTVEETLKALLDAEGAWENGRKTLDTTFSRVSSGE